MLNPYRIGLSVALVLVLVASGAEADRIINSNESADPLIFNVPFPEAHNPATKQALTNRVKSALSKPATIQTADFWQFHLRAIRDGDGHLFLAESHFASWLVFEHNFVPITQLSEPVSYVIAAQARDVEVFSWQDLSNFALCGPHMLSLGNQFTHALFKPLGKTPEPVAGWSSDEWIDQPGRCRGILMTQWKWRSLERHRSSQWIVLAQSETRPNLTLLAGPSVDATDIDALRTLSLSDEWRDLIPTLTDSLNPDADWVEVDQDSFKPEWANTLRQWWPRSEPPLPD